MKQEQLDRMFHTSRKIIMHLTENNVVGAKAYCRKIDAGQAMREGNTKRLHFSRAC